MSLFKILIILLMSFSSIANDVCTYTEHEENEVYSHYEYQNKKYPNDNTALKWLYQHSFQNEFSSKIQELLRINTYLTNGVSYGFFKYYLLKQKIPNREDHENLMKLFIHVHKTILKKNINVDFKLYKQLVKMLCINRLI